MTDKRKAIVDGAYGWSALGPGRVRLNGQDLQPPRIVALKASAWRTLGGLIVAAVLWVLDLRLGAALVVVAVLSVSLVAVASPAVGAYTDARIARLAALVGRSVTTVLLTIVYFVVITPVAFLLRASGRNALAAPGVTSESTWIATSHASDPAMVRRQFTIEREVTLGKRQGRTTRPRRLVVMTIRAAVLMMALDLIVGTVYLDDYDQSTIDHDAARLSSAALGDEGWAVDYFNEYRDLSSSFVPFLGMAIQAHKGRYINIAHGARNTYLAEGVGDDATSVYFFGGSTTWGLGQRDLYTIPSYVARLAEEDGIPVRVSNYGQNAWSIWQQLALLEQLLSEGNVPDAAVFYNGHNEVGQQVQELTVEPSYPQANLVKQAVNRERIRGTFPGLKDAIKGFYADHSILARIALKFRSRTSGPAPTSELSQVRALNAVELQDRAVEVIESLSKSYGFEAVFIWQPNAYTTQGGDAERFARADHEGFGTAYRDATELVGPPVIDLADSLDGVKDAVFFDDVHTNELGAEVVAEAIYPYLQAHLGKQ